MLLIITLSCRTKQTCGGFLNPIHIKSTVTELKLTGIADTTIAYISGITSGKYKKRYKAEIMPSCIIKLVNKQSQAIFSTIAGDGGIYKLALSAGTYDIEVSGMSCNDIVIRDVKIGTGYMMKLDVILGNAGENEKTSIYQMKEDGSLIEIQ